MSVPFVALCLAAGIPEPTAEYRFHPVRRWRFDWALVEDRIAVEIDGGVWLKGGGRHNRGKGYLADMDKLNAAACLGWRIIRVTPRQFAAGEAVELLRRAINREV